MTSNQEARSIQVFNALGELIYFSEIKATETEVDLSNHAKGIYFIRIDSYSTKIIKD